MLKVIGTMLVVAGDTIWLGAGIIVLAGSCQEPCLELQERERSSKVRQVGSKVGPNFGMTTGRQGKPRSKLWHEIQKVSAIICQPGKV